MMQCGWDLSDKLSRSQPISLFRVMNGWISFAIGFATIYLALFIMDSSSFDMEGWIGQLPPKEVSKNDIATESHVPGISVSFLYFSIATMTTLGFDDIACKGWFAQMLASVEMLVGILFSVMIFGVSLTFFQKQEKDGTHTLQKYDHDYSCFRRCMRWIRQKIAFVDDVRHFLVQNLVLLVLAFQVACVEIVVVLDPDLLSNPQAYKSRGFLVLCVLQAVLVMVIFLTSLRIVFKMSDHAEIGIWFLIQSYLCIILLFDGIYLLVFLFNREAFTFVEDVTADVSPLQAIWKFFYLSMSVMTTTGYGDITPRLMIARLVVTFHMIISQVYHMLILGLGTTKFITLQHESAAPKETYSMGLRSNSEF